MDIESIEFTVKALELGVTDDAAEERQDLSIPEKFANWLGDWIPNPSFVYSESEESEEEDCESSTSSTESSSSFFEEEEDAPDDIMNEFGI